METEKTEKKDYSKTVFLPKTSFSMKANLTQKEPQILKFWEEIDLYKKILEMRENSRHYILHDGPPYANGHIHIGHALNKILKDILVKSHSLIGFKTPYIPGWDCHGLPIEHQLLKELKMNKRHVEDVNQFRNKAKEFAKKFIDIQKEEFKRLGVIGDWENPYITMSNDYEATVIKSFIELLEKGYIKRDKKTIYWCVSCETALADAEVEYKDKTSHSIFVRFKVLKAPKDIEKYLPKLYIVIWTTTPWTLPANMAAAVSEKEEYRIVKFDDAFHIIADKLVDSFIEQNKILAEKLEKIDGSKLLEIEYEHCLLKYISEDLRFPRRVISTDFVDMTTGSGIVHIAPGHGEEDFYAGKKWGLEVICPVNEEGKFTSQALAFEGMKIFEANDVIIDKLREDKLLISSSTISHSYPHCWRCKNPVIFRATHQWFLKVDVNNLREKLIEKAGEVNWFPPAGKERITSMLKLRPDWCLSRQRYWGTPIMAFYCKKCNKLQEDIDIMKGWQKRVEKEGSDFWFSEPIEKLIPENYSCSCGSKEFYKEKDILDVWLDSGVSWYAVVKNRMGENYYPVDMYLEGSDQHRGWFQTSLIPSVALNSLPPYKNVITHGFVLDDQGRAMHKSLGNVVSPQEVINKYGADVLRLWVALSDYNDDVRISDKLLAVPVDTYRKIRNTFRYLLGNLNGYDNSKHRVPVNKMLEFDLYILHQLSDLNKKVKDFYLKFEYRAAIRAIADFCIINLSSFYLDALKDRLYTMPINSLERRSAQTALYDTLKSLLVLTSPILSYTCEEAWQTMKKEVDSTLSESVFLNNWPEINLAPINVLKWEKIMFIREKTLKLLEELRQKGEIGSSVEAEVFVKAPSQDFDLLSNSITDLTWALIVSNCYVEKSEGKELEIYAKHASGEKCPRCWQWRNDIGLDKDYPMVCVKCAKALRSLDNLNE